MPKRVPEHWKVLAIRGEPDDVLDTHSFGIAALKAVRDTERTAATLALTK